MGPIATVLSGPSLTWTIDAVFRAPSIPQDGARTSRASRRLARRGRQVEAAATYRPKPVNHLPDRRGEPTLLPPAEVELPELETVHC